MDALVLAEEAERLAADFTFWVAVSVGRKGEVSCVEVCLGGGREEETYDQLQYHLRFCSRRLCRLGERFL